MDVQDTSRPRRHKIEAKRPTLKLEDVIRILGRYQCSDYDHGGINCSLCGKLYKSKVCFTKHIWEHSIYWDMFDGEKNQDRVLSIQAAVILYSGCQSKVPVTPTKNPSNNNLLASLLVTSPQKHKEKDDTAATEKTHASPAKRKVLAKALTGMKKKRLLSGSDPADGLLSDPESPQRTSSRQS